MILIVSLHEYYVNKQLSLREIAKLILVLINSVPAIAMSVNKYEEMTFCRMTLRKFSKMTSNLYHTIHLRKQVYSRIQ